MNALVFLLLCLIWGSTWIGIKIGLSDMPPLYASGLRFVISVTILYLIILIKGYRLPRSVVNWARLGHPGLYMYGLSYGLIYTAETYINSAMTAVLFASFPLFVAVLSVLMKNEKLRPLGWMGLVLGFAGVVMIFYNSLQISPQLFLGSGLALAGSLGSAIGVVIHKRSFSQENVFVATAVQMTAGGVPLLLLAVMLENFGSISFTAETIGSLLYLSIFGSVIAFVGYYWLLAREGAVKTSLIAFVTPLIAIYVGVTFFGESLSALMIAGSGVSLVGVYLVVKKQKTIGQASVAVIDSSESIVS